MESKEFSHIRHFLGKGQRELARLLCVSTKAIQSFEGGWRNIPSHAERQLLFLLTLKRSLENEDEPCWEVQNCCPEWREKCSVWEFKAGHFCWFISGTYCQGKYQENWKNKMKLCQQCDVFRSMIPPMI